MSLLLIKYPRSRCSSASSTLTRPDMWLHAQHMYPDLPLSCSFAQLESSSPAVKEEIYGWKVHICVFGLTALTRS